jgi:4-hydroxybenzoate polyprenyltransferase
MSNTENRTRNKKPGTLNLEPGTYFRIYRLYSLDIVLGAAGASYMASCFTGTSCPLLWWILLPLTVWIIYTFDHWADGRLISGSSERYLYYKKHGKTLLVLLFIQCTTWLIAACCFFDAGVLSFGIALSIPLVLYFWLHLSGRAASIFFREPGIALIYTLAVAGYPVLQAGNYSWAEVFFLIQFFLVVLGNVLLFSCLDFETDRAAGRNSFAVRYGWDAARMEGMAVTVAGVLLAIACIILFGGAVRQFVFVLTGIICLGHFLLLAGINNPRIAAWAGMVADQLFLLCWMVWLVK